MPSAGPSYQLRSVYKRWGNSPFNHLRRYQQARSKQIDIADYWCNINGTKFIGGEYFERNC
jgi:hypothetical protein